MCVPARFLPFRSNRTLTFINFGAGDDVSAEEKNFFCTLARDGAFPQMPELTANCHLYNKQTNRAGRFCCAMLLKQYGVSKTRYDKWKKIFDNPTKAFAETTHRPFALDSEAVEKVVQDTLALRRKHKPPNNKTMMKMLKEAALDTKKRRFEEQGKETAARLDDSNLGIRSKLGVISYLKDAGEMSQRKAKDLTTSREGALSCVQHVYGQGIVAAEYMGHLPAASKYNQDKTTFEYKPNSDNKMVWIVHDKNDQTPIASSEVTSTMSTFISWISLGAADGYIGDTVLLAQVDGIPEGEFFKSEVIGLTHSSETTKKGTIYYCKSRAGNAAMYKDMYTTSTFPQIDKRAKELEELTGSPVHSVLTSDGEAVALSSLAAVVAVAAMVFLHLMKLLAGGTSKVQPWDVCKIYESVKAGVKYINNNDINTSNAVLEHSMQQSIAALRAKYPGADTLKLTANKATQLIDAVGVIVWALKAKRYVTPEKMIQGWFESGLHCLRPDEKGYTPPLFPVVGHEALTVDIDKMIKATYVQVPRPEYQNMIDRAPAAMDYARANGRLTHAHMTDVLKIYRDPNVVYKDRDGLCITYAGATLISHAESILRNIEWKEAHKKPAPEDMEAAQVRKKAQALVDKTEKLAVRVAATKAKNDAEKARFAALSPAEKKQDKADKKIQRETAARQKEEANAAALEAARALL